MTLVGHPKYNEKQLLSSLQSEIPSTVVSPEINSRIIVNETEPFDDCEDEDFERIGSINKVYESTIKNPVDEIKQVNDATNMEAKTSVCI